MVELGKKSEISGADQLRKLQLYTDIPFNNGPESMPKLGEGEKVIVGYDQGLGERMIVCDTIEELQELYRNYAMGHARTINFYAGKDPGFITVL